MRPALATVLSARTWEPTLVRLARASALARVVGRAWESTTIDTSGPDVVVVGAETAWLSKALVAAWQGVGRAVVGVHRSDAPDERAAVIALGVDAAVGDDDVEQILLRACRMASHPRPIGPLVAVTGPRGAPGRSTVALAIGAGLADATVVDADPEPNLGPLLGLPPGPIRDDLVRSLRASGTIPGIHRTAGTRVWAPFGPIPGEALSCLRASGPVVVDAGPFPAPSLPAGTSLDVFVVDASAVGIVRAGTALHAWEGRPPALVLNGVVQQEDALRACRAATGLEPAAVIPRCAHPLEAARAALDGLAA